MSQQSTEEAPRPSRWFPFAKWCAAKNFTVQHGYNEIDRGNLETVTSGRRRFVTEEQDRAYDERCKANALNEAVG